jgi:hypothetical protein
MERERTGKIAIANLLIHMDYESLHKSSKWFYHGEAIRAS